MVIAELVFGFDEVIADDAKFVTGFEADIFIVDSKFAVISARNNFAVIGGRITVITIDIIFGAGKFDGLIGASIDSKETAGERLSHMGVVIIVVGNIEARERIKNLSSDSLVGNNVIVVGEDEFIDENVNDEAKADYGKQNSERQEFGMMMRLRRSSDWRWRGGWRGGWRRGRILILRSVRIWLHTEIF